MPSCCLLISPWWPHRSSQPLIANLDRLGVPPVISHGHRTRHPPAPTVAAAASPRHLFCLVSAPGSLTSGPLLPRRHSPCSSPSSPSRSASSRRWPGPLCTPAGAPFPPPSAVSGRPKPFMPLLALACTSILTFHASPLPSADLSLPHPSFLLFTSSSSYFPLPWSPRPAAPLCSCVRSVLIKNARLVAWPMSPPGLIWGRNCTPSAYPFAYFVGCRSLNGTSRATARVWRMR